MRALSSQDNAASSSLTKESINWVLDDAYAKVIGKIEYTGRVLTSYTVNFSKINYNY